MLAEFLTALVRLAREADKVEIIPIPGDPRHVLVREGQMTSERDVPAPLRTPKISSFPDFAAAVRDPAICPAPEIYYGPNGAVCYCDRADRREAVTLPLEWSEQWSAVLALRAGKSLTPKEAIAFLRYEINAASAEPVIAGLRRIDFTRTGTGKSVVEHGRESLGRAVEAAVVQADQIPEAFDITIRPVVNDGFQTVQVTVRCGVVIDFEQQRIVLRLLPDEATRARQFFLVKLGSLLADDLPGIPAFNGTAA